MAFGGPLAHSLFFLEIMDHPEKLPFCKYLDASTPQIRKLPLEAVQARELRSCVGQLAMRESERKPNYSALPTAAMTATSSDFPLIYDPARILRPLHEEVHECAVLKMRRSANKNSRPRGGFLAPVGSGRDQHGPEECGESNKA